MNTNAEPDSMREADGSLDRSRPRFPAWLAAALILSFCVVMGFQATRLNHQLYTHRQPFFDSLSYYSRLHRVMSISRDEGVGQALHDACFSTTTICLPYVIGALVAPLAEPSRAVGVWIQIAQLAGLTLSLLYYLTRTRRAHPAFALLMIVPFFCLACIGSEEGGLSDFRMDLGLMLMLGTACVWYLIAQHSGRMWHFALFGLIAGLAMLGRATAPVYLIVSLAPIALVDFFRSSARWRLARGLVISGAVGLLTSLWFFVRNFQHLYFYYFVWNTDANAGLSPGQSFKHVEFALDHVGAPVQIWIVIAYCTIAAILLLGPPGLIVQRCKSLLEHIDWRLVWMAVGPLAFLVFRGAGLNPFVCMPGTFGMVLALVVPLTFIACQPRPHLSIAALTLAAIVCVASVSIRTHRAHEPGPFNSMAAHREILDAVTRDARAHRIRMARYATVHVHYVNAPSLHNVVLFDVPAVEFRRATPLIDGIPVVPDRSFMLAAAVDWRRTPGDSDMQKIQYLVQLAEDHIDYLVLPDEASAKRIATDVSAVMINRHAPQIRQLLIDSANWEPVSKPIVNNDIETVRVYRNVTRVKQRQAQGKRRGKGARRKSR